MSAQSSPTRQRLIRAAIKLFAAQGVTDTTTKQIAELARVNEVTLFRHFGNKHGLLLAVIEEAAVFTQLGRTLIQRADQTSSIHQALKDYATACLQALERVPEVVRSVVGEAGQFPSENREALGRGLTQANRYVAEYFQTVIDRGQLQTHLPAEKLASLLHGMLLGYAVIEFTSEFHNLWRDRDDFLENLVTLFLHGAVSPSSSLPQAISLPGDSPLGHSTALSLQRDWLGEPATLGDSLSEEPGHRSGMPLQGQVDGQAGDQLPSQLTERVVDLSAEVVHQILQRAKKMGLQDYALAYVLFAAGLTPAEMVGLQRSHYVNDNHHQILRILNGGERQVPINQWILGKRYGSHSRNPLSQWMKSRKDDQAALFLNSLGGPLSETELRQRWQRWVEGVIPTSGQPLAMEQAQQTWCVEMLGRGMTTDDLAILTGWDVIQLQPYAIRAREKAALEQALRLDQKV